MDKKRKIHNEMLDRIKLDLKFDPQRLLDDLGRIQSSDWISHFVTQNYDGDWSIIPLRGPSTATHPVMMIYSDPTCKEFSDTPFLKESPYFCSVLESFKCPLQAARLMKLSPGSHIKKHSDFDLAAEMGMARLHIPIVTNDSVDFKLNDIRIEMKRDECWYLRLSDPHSVKNNGETDRVHLVIDIEVNPWFISRLESKTLN